MRFPTGATGWRSSISAALFPPDCATCGQRGVWVCDLCRQDSLPLVDSLCCERCGHPLINGRCECRTMHPAIVRARALAVYDGWIAESIRRVKYHREQDRIAVFAHELAGACVGLGPIDVIVPVPLHPNRLHWRGFNQAEILARCLAHHWDARVDAPLVRTRETDTQTRHNREERSANMDGAFATSAGWKPEPNKHYLLVDDVYTTGATLNACADVLDAAGVQAISVLTIAFDLQDHEREIYRKLVRTTSLQ